MYKSIYYLSIGAALLIPLTALSDVNEDGNYCDVYVSSDPNNYGSAVLTLGNGSLSGNTNYGIVAIGNSLTQQYVIENSGTANLDIGSISNIDSPFSLAEDNCSNSSVSPSNSCSFDDTPEPRPSGDLHVFSGNGNTMRSQLSLAQLNTSSLSMMDFSHYSHGTSEIDADNSNASEPSNRFEGRLILNSGNKSPMSFNETTPGKNISSAYNEPDSLPSFDFEFVQTGSHIIPKRRGLIETSHGNWNYILEPGRVWNENTDNGYSRVAIPFALQEKYANCTHNGIITFAFKDDGSITNAAVQIGAETCLYYNYEMWGMLSADYQAESVDGAATLISEYESEVLNRIPTLPIERLTDLNASINVSQIATEQQSSPTTHGVYYNGVHYAASCSSKWGDYPYCEVMALPSYSTAKTAGAGFAHALLTQQFGNSARYLNIADNVPECQDGINGTSSIWSDVTVENALDMATGNYRLSSYQGDEGSSNVSNNFFLVFGHDGKIRHACERYIRKSSPNTHFSYHSSDTYIAGVAMDNWYSGDLYEKLVNEVYKPLHLSPATYTTVRTQGSPANTFWSHGINWHKDDMVKIGKLINDRGMINGQQVLDPEIMDDMLLANSNLGLETYGSESTYINTVWTFDMGQRTGAVCPNGSWVSYMSGYGGIGVVMYPNGAIFYYVSDSDAYGFGGAEIELHKLANICGN